MRKGGLERETGEGIYEILTDGWSLFALISGHHIALFLALYLFSLFHSRAYFAPGLTVLFSSDTPDYSRLPSSAALIIFFYFFFFFVFLLLHRYVNEGGGNLKVFFISVVSAFHITRYHKQQTIMHVRRDRQIDPGGGGKRSVFHTLSKNGR